MRLGIYGFIALAVVGTFIYDYYNKKVNFAPVNARVSAVTEQCYLEKKERGVLTRTTSTSDMLGCDMAETLTKVHPKWYGYDVKHKIEIRFVYTSPVDGATHSSSLEMPHFPGGKLLRAGDVFLVRASKSEPGKTRAA